MFVDTQCFHLTITDSLCQSTTINARSKIDFTDHFIVHQWTRYRELQWYNDSMNNDNNQWSKSPTCIWCRNIQWYNEQWQWQWWKPSYWPQRLEATETAAGFQAKFGQLQQSLCFKQNWYGLWRCSSPSKAMTRRIWYIVKSLKYIQSTENRKQAAANCIVLAMVFNWK